MLKDTVTVKNKTGLHARPAGIIAKLTKKYSANIELIYNNKTIKAKSVMGILGAGIVCGSNVDILCDGEDEQLALEELKALFADGFGES